MESSGQSAAFDFDLPCRKCRYNLRGLRLADRCPECGTDVIESVRAADARGESFGHQVLRLTFQPVAERVGCPVDGVMFVADALKLAQHHAATARGRRAHADARDVCAAVRELAINYFNDADEARELLAEWGIRGSEDVGAIVFALVAAGHGTKSATDQVADFDGLFTLDTLFTS